MRISDWSSDVCSSDLLIEDLLLLEHLREHDVPGHHGHEDEDEEGGPCNRAALLKGRHQAIGIRITGVFHSRSEEHTSELQSLMRISYAVFCLKKKKQTTKKHTQNIVHTT